MQKVLACDAEIPYSFPVTETPQRPALNGNQIRLLRTLGYRSQWQFRKDLPKGVLRPYSDHELRLFQQLEALGYLRKYEENLTFGFWVLTDKQ